MKRTLLSIFVIATVALTMASCQKEKFTETDSGKTVTLSFDAKMQQPKTTLTTTDDATFTAAWKEGDMMTLYYTDAIAEEGDQTEAAYADGKFTFEVPAKITDHISTWDYMAVYGGEEALSFARTQTGNEFNGDSEMMMGVTEVSAAKFGENISFDMERLTSILYFHLTNCGSAITEPVTKAVLTVGEGEVLAADDYDFDEDGNLVPAQEATTSNTITLNVSDGVAMNDADGIQLWFNVQPGKYSTLNLVVETANYRFTIDTKDAPEGYTLEGGQLTKVIGKAKSNYELKEGDVEFGDNVFDNCDYSPYVTGATVNAAAYPVLDSQNKKEGAACYSFDMKADAGKLIGPASIKRGEAMPVSGAYNDYLSFWIYTDKAIDMTQPNTFLIAELSTSGTFDTEEYQWTYFNTKLNAGWNEVKLYFKDATASAVAPDLTKGFNFFRVYIQEPAAAQGDAYTIKIDDIKVVPSDYVAITTYPKDQNGSAVSGLQFRNTHPVFSKDKKTAYVSSTVGHIVAIDLEKGIVKWVYKPSTTSGCATICVNPVNGDIYGTNKNALVYAVKADGTKHWEHSGFKAWGSTFAVSTDGSVVFAVGGNNRQIEVMDSENGSILQDYNATAAGGNSNIYTNNAQIVVFNQDSDYDYIAVEGNEVISIHKLDKSTKKLQFVKALQAKPKNNKGTAASQSATDISSAAVSADKSTVYFLGASYTSADKATWHYGNVFVLNVSNPASPSIKYAKIEETTAGVATSGIVISADNNIVVTCGPNISTYKSATLNEGGTPTAVAKVKVSGGNTNSFNFICPSITESKNIYFSIDNVAPASIFKSAIGSNAATKVCDPYVSASSGSTSFQGVFAMTDGYAVVGTPAGIYVKKVDEKISPNTWGYFGGDSCGSKNANLVYGN